MTNPRNALLQARIDLATDLEALPSADARVAMTHATVEQTGGSFIPPCTCPPWGSHMAELSMLGVSHTGEDEPAAVSGWIKSVTRMAQDAELQGDAA